ncbi:hypothetical protein CC77DRAFT_1018573 [Alternaria alternata]|uniref:Uncharacterized protein n=2 Tax=Alternaria alternata complex TaxID=187734 RepID=A0A177DSP1_ALTAL|nr:hypothetical protein CC77DRAFT_1018573 [Alternaria alternata]OAG22546.1 hypothetical protein CC77DRAFT_1018573 [Alternaria alternata]RYN34478.1 hypothetical protein AA0115_g2789 [Alternaria tenuissima]RYN59707.1 hypothetical protein AA0118_g6524 [Alternaria tenuissima]
MSDPYAASRLYRKNFEDAEALFDSGDVAGCISAAQYNLTDTSLPPFYIIRNCILLVGAMDNWDDGNEWRLAAESTYSDALRRSREMNDTNSLAALQDLREELDEWARQRDRDLQEHMLEQEEEDDDDEMDLEAYGVELDNSEEEAEMEAEGVELGEGDELMRGVDGEDTQLLPIRGHQASTAGPVEPAIEAATVVSTPSIVVESPTEPTALVQDDDQPARSLRKKKSRKFGGGAANMHAFNKSLGRSSGKLVFHNFAEDEDEDDNREDKGGKDKDSKRV